MEQGSVAIVREVPRRRAPRPADGSTQNKHRAQLERFMTSPQSVADTDVVVWYAGHYVHDAGVEIGNRVGPDPVPSGG